jgi:Minichromosome loss protein, Mcl1, middle region
MLRLSGPAVLDSGGVLHDLHHFKSPLKAIWVHALDITKLDSRQGKDESCWPVDVSRDAFICLILKACSPHRLLLTNSHHSKARAPEMAKSFHRGDSAATSFLVYRSESRENNALSDFHLIFDPSLNGLYQSIARDTSRLDILRDAIGKTNHDQ